MKPHILSLIITLTVASVGPTFAANGAQDHRHEHSAGQSATLQLNAGNKWETDAPLRKAMGDIRQSMADSLQAIHNNRLSAKDYAALAKNVENAVGDMVANCKLGAKADEQLHIIIANLLTGAKQMTGKTKRVDGAVKVIGALDNYGKYFDDPSFKPIAH